MNEPSCRPSAITDRELPENPRANQSETVNALEERAQVDPAVDIKDRAVVEGDDVSSVDLEGEAVEPSDPSVATSEPPD